jgi:hypothetical protein
LRNNITEYELARTRKGFAILRLFFVD